MTAKKQSVKKWQYRRKYKVASAADVARPLFDRALRAKGFVQTEVVSRWSQIVGQELALATVPVQLRFKRGERTDGTLVVRCESAFAPLLQHHTVRIIDQVNTYFGYGAVAKVTVQQGPIKRAKGSRWLTDKELSAEETQKLDAIVGDQDSELASAIKSLGSLVMAHKKNDH